MKYVKKPIEVEAMQFTDESKDQVFNFIRCSCIPGRDKNGNVTIDIHTLEGAMRACLGDWVIKGIKGEFYPCKPDIFEATYDLVE